LKAVIHDLSGFIHGDFTNVAVMIFINKFKKLRKRVAVFKAHAATMANFKGAGDFFLQHVLIKVPRVTRGISKALGGLIRNVVHKPL
jgi:hypothetical protein